MNPIAQAICLAALVLSFNHICTAADESAPHAKLLINYPDVIRCYDDGRVEFQDWKRLPGSTGMFPRGQTFVACTAQLPPDELRKVIDAVDEYLANPAPFIYANLSIHDVGYYCIEIRHGQKIRVSCVRYMPEPAALVDLFEKIREPLAAAKLTSIDMGRRDQILAGFKPGADQSTYPRSPRSRIASVRNDDPDKLIPEFFDASGRHRDYFTVALGSLASLEDTAFGDVIYANIQSHRDTLSVDEQSETLAIAIEGGSLKAVAEYPTVEHSPWAMHRVVTQVLGADDLRIIAARIGVSAVTASNVPTAWNWLASNTDQLQFDRITRQYHIVGSIHPVVMSRKRDILSVAGTQPAPRLVAERFWAIAVLIAMLAAIQFARALLKRSRAKARRCVACGYDLRGTPGRCPECGTPATAAR